MTEEVYKNLLPLVGVGMGTFPTYWVRPRNLGKVRSYRPELGSRVEKTENGGIDDAKSALGRLGFSGTSQREILPLEKNYT